jgi:hypothetical protein
MENLFFCRCISLNSCGQELLRLAALGPSGTGVGTGYPVE